MRTALLTLTATVLIGAVVGLLAAGSLTGRWNLNVTATPHGDMTAVLVLDHKDEGVKGTFIAHGNEHPVAGTFRAGTLQLETTNTPADRSMSLTAKLQEDGTLSGYISSAMGDMKWTASKAKESK